MVNNKDVKFEIYTEQELSWQQHHEIHNALNLAYGHRTHTFATKTYPYYPPIKRILCRLNGDLIGHTAIFEADLLINDQDKIRFGGIGMTLSLKPFLNLSHSIRSNAVDVCAAEGFPFAIGRVKNSPRVKANLSDLVSHFLDLPLIGQTTRSHDWETLAIYDTGYDKKAVDEWMQYCIQQGCVKIAKEVF